jgi:hypothetical protein
MMRRGRKGKKIKRAETRIRRLQNYKKGLDVHSGNGSDGNQRIHRWWALGGKAGVTVATSKQTKGLMITTR